MAVVVQLSWTPGWGKWPEKWVTRKDPTTTTTSSFILEEISFLEKEKEFLAGILDQAPVGVSLVVFLQKFLTIVHTLLAP